MNNILRYYCAVFIGLFSNSVAGAQLPEYLKLHADTTPAEIRKFHYKLATYLAKPCKTETEKAVIFTYWIAKNIRYDLKESRENGRNKIAREVLNDKRAVCGGYSDLMKQLCDDVDLRCYYVSGYAWGGFFEHYLSQDKNRHAWNVVHVDGSWKVVDVTWSRDQLKTKEFKNSRTIKWVFMNPIEFAATHLPRDPRWQLLNDPKTAPEFWKKEEFVKRKYNSSDSLKILLKKDRVDGRIISIKGIFTEDGQVEEFVNNLNLLGFELVGGGYDSTNISRSVSVFNIATAYYNSYAPYKNHKDHLTAIKTGLWLAKRRMEMKK
ncbi:MAG: hypothetical protein ACI8ZM_003596 [Crocinitomix sp.]|jgi:hypothetical protein